MKILSKWLLLPLYALLLGSCATTKMVYETTYKGKPVKVYSREEKGVSTNSITWQVQLGRLPRVKIDAHSTDLYGPPYSDDIYKGIPHQYIHNPITRQDTNPVGTPMVGETMLYFNPARFNRAEYDAYTDFFREMWPHINKEINKDYVYLRDQIIGTVYGEQDDFVEYFVGKEADGKAYYFDIQPDGSILYHSGKGPEESTGFQGSGLAEKVEMPGKIIRITDTSSFNKMKLRGYKDKAGKRMEDYFTVVEGK